MTRACRALLVLVALACSAYAADYQPINVNVLPANVTENEAHLGAAQHIGWTQMNGDPVITFQPTQVTISISLTMNINQDRYQQYTIGEPQECAGIQLILYKEFIEAHENTHVTQIRTAVQTALNGSMTYDARARKYKFFGSDFDMSNRMRKQINDVVNSLIQQDAADYAGHAAGDRYGRMESEARNASCQEFMHDIGNHLLDLLNRAETDAQQALNLIPAIEPALKKATAGANGALAAAEAMLKAAADCDADAFRKALDAFKNALATAEKDYNDAVAAKGRAAASTASARHFADLYDTEKRLDGVIVFPRGDAKWRDLTDTVNRREQRLQGLDLSQAGKIIDRAKGIAQQAVDDFAKCPNNDGPCPGKEISLMGVYRRCEADGFWHEIPFERWQCPPPNSTIISEAEFSDEKTNEPCVDCPDPLSIMGQKRVCRDGFWHEIVFERWECKDGKILSEADLSDRQTDEPCTEEEERRSAKEARFRSQDGRILAPVESKGAPRGSRKPARPLPLDWKELEKSLNQPADRIPQ